jgi:hypothetical protein
MGIIYVLMETISGVKRVEFLRDTLSQIRAVQVVAPEPNATPQWLLVCPRQKYPSRTICVNGLLVSKIKLRRLQELFYDKRALDLLRIVSVGSTPRVINDRNVEVMHFLA